MKVGKFMNRAERIQRQRLATAQYLYRREKDIERWHAKEDADPSQWEIALTRGYRAMVCSNTPLR